MPQKSIRKYVRKTFFSIHLFLICLLVSGISTADTTECFDNKLVHGWGGDWVPFVMGTPKQPSGLDMEILEAIVKEAGCRWRNTEYPIPWVRHLKMISAGSIDLATAASWTEERADYAHFSLPYRSESVALFVLKESLEKYTGQNFVQLKKMGFRLGVPRGDYLGEELGRFVESLGKRVFMVDDNSQNLKKLLLKRIDAYVGHIPHDSLYLQEMEHQDKVQILPGAIYSTGDIHIMISKKSRSATVLDKLNKAIESLKNNGTLQSIKDKYSKEFNTRLD